MSRFTLFECFFYPWVKVGWELHGRLEEGAVRVEFVHDFLSFQWVGSRSWFSWCGLMYGFGVVGKLAVRSRLGGLFRGFLLFGFVVFLWMLVASGLVFLCRGAGGHVVAFLSTVAALSYFL